MKLLTLKEIQALQLSLVIEIDKVCRRHGIKYYLISGSCLGAVRHGGFIPWDDDIDIAMMRPDYERFISIFPEEFDTEKYKLVNENVEEEFTASLSRIIFKGTRLVQPTIAHLKVDHGMFLDVFPLDNVPDDDTERQRQHQELEKINNTIYKKVWPKSTGRYAGIKNLVKTMRSLAMLAVSLKSLKDKRHEVITRFDSMPTECVCSMASKYGYARHIMPREIYGEPAYLEFEGVSLPFPQQYKEHLRRLFGPNYMKLPPEDKRETPTPVEKL